MTKRRIKQTGRNVAPIQAVSQPLPLGWEYTAQPGRRAPGLPCRDISLAEAQRNGIVDLLNSYALFYSAVYVTSGDAAKTED
jgi:hypothetical protein